MKIIIRNISLSLVFLPIAGFVAYYILYDLTLEAVRTPIGSSYFSKGDFLIDPGAFLPDLHKGETNLFLPIPPTSEAENAQNDSKLDNYYSWSQADYLAASVALHRLVWNDDLKNWNLFSMDFGTICHDDPHGFDSGDITYFKIADYKIQ